MTIENIIIYQGADFTRNIALSDQNGNPLIVSGYFANASMKIDAYSALANVYVFETNITNGQCIICLLYTSRCV